MHWTIILFLISLIINGIIVYLVRNSHDYRDRPFKFPLIIWILVGISTFVPIVNSIGSLVLIIITIAGYSEGDIEFNDDFWLIQEY